MSKLDLATELGAILKARGETVAVSESSTGGLVSANLLSISGASKYFLGGGVIYTYDARERIPRSEQVRSTTNEYLVFTGAYRCDVTC